MLCGGVGDESERENEFKSFQIIDMYRYIGYIISTENDVVDQNSKPS